MKKLFYKITLVAAIMTATITCFAEKVIEERDYAGIVIINNQFNNIDYKITASATDAIRQEIAPNTEIEVLYQEGYSNLNELGVEESWLISNDIMTRPFQLTDNNCISSGLSLSDNCNKTDLYVMLYKAYFGVLESRPVVMNYTSFRNGTYVNKIDNYKETNDSIINASFPYGDYYVYVSSTVYELYLQELMNKGYLDASEFNSVNGASFLKDYNLLNEVLPEEANIAWDNRLPYKVNAMGVLGYTHNYSNVDGISITESKPNYFVAEKLITIDALSIIADFVRLSEKDMSDLEASMVSYKYGVNYLGKVTDEQKRDIEFLIAKGILDFENPNEYTNLYGEFTYEEAVKILYRVANADARLNFSEMTLTDTDSFWMEQGYYENRFSIKAVTELPHVETITEEYWNTLIENDKSLQDTTTTAPTNTETPSNDTFIDDILETNVFQGVYIYADSDLSKYTVVKMFDASFSYRYKGILLTELEESTDKPEEFVSIEGYQFKMIDSEQKKLFNKVTFSVEATDYETAVLYVDNNITIDSSVNNNDVIGYTTVIDGEEEITLISATSLRDGISDISIIEDKVLLNNVTGTQAIILPEEGYALVGNRIVRSNTLMMTDTSDEVYYNLDVICVLLSNTYLSNLTDRELYICTDLNNERVTPVYGNLGNKLCDTYTIDVKGVSKEHVDDNTLYLEDVTFFNVDNIQEGLNILTRRFPVNVAGEVQYVTVIVEWEYIVPDAVVLADTTDSLLDGTNQLTMTEVNEAIYTRPIDASLQEWWDSNISISNSLANFMYGTQGVDYIKSGYLVPNLTILRDSNISDAAVSAIFTSNGFKLDSIGLEYCKSTTKWWETYYSASMMEDSYAKSLALANRGYSMINAKEMTDGKIYDDSYYVTNAGVVYANVRVNSRINYRDNKLTITNRKITNNRKLGPNTEFLYNGNPWLYIGTERIGENVYFVIQPNFEVSDFNAIAFRHTEELGILPKFTNLDEAATNIDLSTQAEAKLKDFYAKYFPEVTTWASYAKSSNMFTANAFCIKQYFGELYDEDAYYVADDVLIDSSGRKVTLEKGVDYTSYGDKKIYCIPKIYIPADSFHFISHEGVYMMLNSTPATALSMNSVITNSISSSVIDSIIYRYTKTIPVNSLISGQRVLIGDIMFTKTTDENGKAILLSDPIQDQALVNSLKFCNKEDELSIIKGALFNGIRVDYNGSSYYLSNFITMGNVGNISNPSDNIGILYSKNGNKYVYNTTTDSSNSPETSNPRAVCIAIQLDDGLLARPTNEKQNTYVLLMVSNTAADKTVDDIPFFTESLSYGDRTSDHITIQNSKFKPSMLYTQARDNFKTMMSQAIAGDLVTIVWMLIFYFAVYMAIIPFVMYAILTKGYGRVLFTAFTLPAHKSKFAHNGIDLIKFFSFGIYNIDSEPTLARTFVSSFVCFFISYAIVFWQPF